MRTKHRLFAALLLMLSLVASRTAGQPKTQPPGSVSVAVGVVRHDGMLVPVARFDGDQWHAATGVTPDWLVSYEWQVWPLAGGTSGAVGPRAVTLGGPEQTASHCETIEVVRTSGVSDLLQPVAPHTFPIGKLGLAVGTREVQVTVPTVLPRSRLQALQAQAEDVYREAEDAYVSAMPAHMRLILPPIAQRLREPVNWSHVYDLGGDAERGRIFMLQGEVSYSETTMTAGQVWLRQDEGDTEPSGEIALSGDAYKTGVLRVPLGSLRLAGRSFVFVDARFYESEAIEIHE